MKKHEQETRRNMKKQVVMRLERSRCVAVVSAGLSAVSLLLSAAVVAWILFSNASSLPDKQQTNPHGEVCLPCLHVTSDPLSNSRSPLVDMLDIRKDEDNDTDICCAHTNAQFAAFFRLILQRQKSIHTLSDILRSSSGKDPVEKTAAMSVSAHLVFKEGLGSEDRQQWKGPSETSWSHVRPGLTFYNSTVHVVTPGLYYVYCHIMYHRGDTSTGVVSGYVYRHSLVYPHTSGILLKTRHTRNDTEDRHSSYVGGQFALHEGDQVFVKLSDPALVSHDEKASFFGMFRVGGD